MDSKIVCASILLLMKLVWADALWHGRAGCLSYNGKPGKCSEVSQCKALFHDQAALNTRDFIATHNGGCLSSSIDKQIVCCPLHSPVVQKSTGPGLEWPPPGPVTNFTVESGTASLLLRWQDPIIHDSGVEIEAFRIIWISNKDGITKNRVREACKLCGPERQIEIEDLHPDTEYTVAIEAKLRSEYEFSIPAIMKVKTL